MRCPSCGRSTADEGCRFDDCGWAPPAHGSTVDSARGLRWVRHARARLRSADAEEAA